MRTLVAVLAVACISGCGFIGFPGVYRIDVEQGNIVTQEMADELKPGMSRRQVRFILGTPLVEDTFNESRWDYIYVKRKGSKVLSESRLTVVFDGDTLAGVEGDILPAAWMDPAAEPEGDTATETGGDADDTN